LAKTIVCSSSGILSWVLFHYLQGVLVRISGIPFDLTDWAQVERTEHKGETGTSYWQTRVFGDIRIRMVEYTAGYLADHWCSKGHVVLCLEQTLGLGIQMKRVAFLVNFGDALKQFGVEEDGIFQSGHP
jgi:hypothetical protein